MAEGTFRRDRILTNMSIRRSAGKMIAELVAPVVPMDDQSGYFPIFGPENITPQEDIRAPGTEATPARWSVTDQAYKIDGHAMKDKVARERQRDAGPNWDLIQATTLNLTDKRILNKEVAFVALLAAGMTGTSLAAQTGTPWNDDDEDPIALIKAQRLACILRGYGAPNIFAVSAPVWDAITLNANVRGLATGAPDAQASVVKPDDFARLIGVDEVIVGEGVYNTAAEGQAASGAWIWGEYALLAVRPASPAPMIPSLAYHLAWRNALEVLTGDREQQIIQGYRLVERYWWQPIKADVVEVHEFIEGKITCMAAGCLFSDCIA